MLSGRLTYLVEILMRFSALCVSFLVLTPLALSQTFVSKDGTSKLQLCSETPCVDVVVGDQKLRFAIDTSQPRSIVDTDLPRLEGLDLEPYVGRDGRANPAYSKTTLPSIKLGTAEMKDLPVIVSHLQHLRAGNIIPDVDGILGYDAFQGKSLTLDLKKMTLAVKAEGSCSGGALKLIPFGATGPKVITTTGFSIEGKPVVAQIDTMFLGAMLIYPTSVDKLGLAPLAETRQREHFAYTDGGVDMLKATAKEDFSGKPIGSDVYFATPEVHLPGGNLDATVGMQALAGHSITLDFATSCFALN